MSIDDSSLFLFRLLLMAWAMRFAARQRSRTSLKMASAKTGFKLSPANNGNDEGDVDEDNVSDVWMPPLLLFASPGWFVPATLLLAMVATGKPRRTSISSKESEQSKELRILMQQKTKKIRQVYQTQPVAMAMNDDNSSRG